MGNKRINVKTIKKITSITLLGSFFISSIAGLSFTDKRYKYRNNSEYREDYWFTPYQYYTTDRNYYTAPPIYYPQNISANEHLGGMSNSRNLKKEISINEFASSWVLLGRSEKAANDSGVLISPQSANTMDFIQSIGRAEDGSSCLIVNAVGNSVSDLHQESIGLYGTLENLKKLREQGAESLTLKDRYDQVRVTFSLGPIIRAATTAYEDNNASPKKDRLYLEIRPSSEEIVKEKDRNASSFYVNVSIITTKKRIPISDQLNNIHVMLRTTSGQPSNLVYFNESKKYATERTWVSDTSGCFATGYVPIGNHFTAQIKQ